LTRPASLDDNACYLPAMEAGLELDADLRPVGPSQVTAAVAWRERLDTQPAAAKVKTQVMADFDKALATFKSAIDARPLFREYEECVPLLFDLLVLVY
jgi:hypothetical protein